MIHKAQAQTEPRIPPGSGHPYSVSRLMGILR